MPAVYVGVLDPLFVPACCRSIVYSVVEVIATGTGVNLVGGIRVPL